MLSLSVKPTFQLTFKEQEGKNGQFMPTCLIVYTISPIKIFSSMLLLLSPPVFFISFVDF